MSVKPVSVGVIGCGEIAQLMHLPFLHELPQFRIGALCDISSSLIDRLGRAYGVDALYTNYREMLADPEIEAVVICNNDHGPVVWDAVAARKHFIVEKPVAFTLAETNGLVDAVAKAGIAAMVGYMKLFDPGYERGVKMIGQIGKPRSIRMHDFAGRFDRYGTLYTQFKADDISTDVLAGSQAAIASKIKKAVTEERQGYEDMYFNILMLGSHDLAVLRGLLGSPTGVAYARAVDREHVFAVLDYADGVPAMLEIAYGPQYEWWDEALEVRGERDEVRVEFQNPYLRHNSADVYFRSSDEAWGGRGYIRGVPDTSFRRQWQHFYEVIRNGVPVRSTLAGGISDIEVAIEIVKVLPAMN